jgi:hypothetical protein
LQNEPYTREKEPQIFARFELTKGIPQKTNTWYEITLTINNVPVATKRVEYKILNEEFKSTDRVLISGRAGAGFEESIIADGDLPIVARGKGTTGSWRTQTTLLEALRRGHGANPSFPVKEALQHIGTNPK